MIIFDGRRRKRRIVGALYGAHHGLTLKEVATAARLTTAQASAVLIGLEHQRLVFGWWQRRLDADPIADYRYALNSAGRAWAERKVTQEFRWHLFSACTDEAACPLHGRPTR